MLLSSAGHPDGPIPAETRRVAGLLAREKTGDILTHLYRSPYLSASEVARLEEVHVATAQRYLKELAEAGLLGCRLRQSGARPTEEYWLLEPRITIQIDLEESDGGSTLADAARRIAVRDRGIANVVYDTNPRTGDVEGVLILSDAQPRLVVDRIRLSTAMGRFLARVPDGTGTTSVWQVMEAAGLSEDHLPEVLAAIDRLSSKRPTAPTGHAARLADPTGVPEGPDSHASARPLDPELEALFRSLAARHDPLLSTPTVAILEVVPLRPAAPPLPGARPPQQKDHDDEQVTPEPLP